MNCKLVHHSPDGDKLVAYIARVSNPKNQDNEATAPKLIKYLIDHKHWSPFEMVSACVEINTTRDIGRQILRHRSFSFQEFSQRYGEVGDPITEREMRSKGGTTRQGSFDGTAGEHKLSEKVLLDCAEECFSLYRQALANRVAPECARAILPEGYAPTRLYMHGTLRSWIHYLQERISPLVQKEHKLIAIEIADLLRVPFPTTFEAVGL